jgi:hypothetical protein
LIENRWKTHLNLRVFIAFIPAMIVYILPFWASVHFGDHHYNENGLMLVYRENILRYFQPFDHKGPIYTYFIYLPIYLLPWTVFFIPALLALKTRWKSLSAKQKWLIWSTVLLFVFFTLSGSRRNYYVLPIVPFALLLTADWILAGAEILRRNIWAGRIALTFLLLFFISFDLGQWVYYSGGGMSTLAETLQQQTQTIKPWSQWNFVMLDPESKIRFYLDLSPDVKNYSVDGDKRNQQTTASLLTAWPFLQLANQQTDTIFLTRKQYESQLRSILTNYVVVETAPIYGERISSDHANLTIAFVPKVKRK